MIQAATIVSALEAYALIGSIVSVVFLAHGIDRVEPSAKGTYVFRVLLVPGVVLLWPLVLVRWRLLARGGPHWSARHSPRRRLHARAALALAIIIPLLLLASFIARQDGPRERPAVLLEAPSR